MASIQDMKEFFSVPGHPVTAREIKDLPPTDRREIMGMLDREKKN